MEASTKIRDLLRIGSISVPSYQRAYSWDTGSDNDKPLKQVNVFLSDLEEYMESSAESAYYFGHFLFEEKKNNTFGVIDGQQRLTTISIFLSVLFSRLRVLRQGVLTEQEQESYEDMVRRNSTYRFETVHYDWLHFKDYVIDQTKKDHNGLETVSARRIVSAFDYFSEKLACKNVEYLEKILDVIREAACTTHPVKNETEAIQMFIFQNNRGKRPSNLEIIKAQFMFKAHLYAGEGKGVLIAEIRDRFEKIYKSISSIEYRINEDEVLVYTLRVFFNSLWESNAQEKINKMLTGEKSISFVKEFTKSLADSFECLTVFFNKAERTDHRVHSLVSLGGIGIALPFVLKSFKYGLSMDKIGCLCEKLESIVLRHRLIGTRAEIVSRLSDVYENFTESNKSLDPIVKRVEWMKNADSWWSYWNNNALKSAIQGWIQPGTAKFLLWKYENYLEGQGKAGYEYTRFDSIKSPELEHIAPQTPTDGAPVAAGYPEYDEEFKNQFIDCLGNYLLLSKSHNCSVGNKPFMDKRSSYRHLAQQREIQEMTNAVAPIWTKELILKRNEKILQFVFEKL